MASLFANRRKPRKGGRGAGVLGLEDDEDSGPVVRKPGVANAPKNKSRLRVSFGPGQTLRDEDLSEDGASVVKPPKRANPAKQVASNNLSKRSWSPTRRLEHTTLRSGQDEDRPSYNKDHLNQLRNSTPSTPRDLSSTSDDDGSIKALNIVSKLGNIGDEQAISAIPTDAEIREKKERRARLAKEQDFISLDDQGDGRFMQLSARKATKETRLVRDDEDLAEGFDDYVEDAGRVALGKKSKAAQARREREAVRDMIADAENVSDEDDSEAERNLAYETAQTRNAMDGLGLNEERDASHPYAPTIITPIPRLSSVLERLRSHLSSLEYNRTRLSKQMADLQQEKAEIAVREVEIQRLLREAGEKYSRLRAESGASLDAASNQTPAERGLETMGNA